MKVTVDFNLPEDQEKFDNFVDSNAWRQILSDHAHDLDQFIDFYDGEHKLEAISMVKSLRGSLDDLVKRRGLGHKW